jgi:hypothetical protein
MYHTILECLMYENHFKIRNVDNNIKMPLIAIHFKLPKCTYFIFKLQ